jgi:hypothetical protein
LHNLDYLFLCGYALVVLIEPGEFLNEPYPLIFIWQALKMVLKCIECHTYRCSSTLGTGRAKPDEASHIQESSFYVKGQPCSVLSHEIASSESLFFFVPLDWGIVKV